MGNKILTFLETPCTLNLRMQGISRGIALGVIRGLFCFYLQSLDGFRTGESAVQELIGKVACLMLEGETLR